MYVVLREYNYLRLLTSCKSPKTCFQITHLRMYLVDSVFPAPLSPVSKQKEKSLLYTSGFSKSNYTYSIIGRQVNPEHDNCANNEELHL